MDGLSTALVYVQQDATLSKDSCIIKKQTQKYVLYSTLIWYSSSKSLESF